ncbi:Uncharacterised protein [Streptococcus pneumoniae]|nr:Uncharacterised protein [Streptococcus pneumoniae]
MLDAQSLSFQSLLSHNHDIPLMLSYLDGQDIQVDILLVLQTE